MTISLYDASVASYLQALAGVANVLQKGREHAEQGGLDLDELVRYRLSEDMFPFSFQVISVWHHSYGAIKGMKAGVFQPPPKMSDMDYAKLEGLVAEATESLSAETPESINALADNPMMFKFGEREVPYTMPNFLLSFSLPNFYFHAATTYDILRMHGVQLGKLDYLGKLRIGA